MTTLVGNFLRLLLVIPITCQAQSRAYPANVNQLVQSEFNAYVKSKSPHNDPLALERISIAGLPRTTQNINSTRELLTRKISEQEKVAAIRLLASMYAYGEKQIQNDAICRDIKMQTFSEEKAVSRAATFAYSRLGFFPDTETILEHAAKKNLITKDEYFGELAHVVRFAPLAEQNTILSKIIDARNEYATEIIASFTQDVNGLLPFSPDARRALQSLLDANVPKFPFAYGEYGYIDAFRYENSLHARAVLASNSERVKYQDFVIRELEAQSTDPRQILAFLSSTKGRAMIVSLRNTERLEYAYTRISDYSASFPGNELVRSLVDRVGRLLRTPPKR